MRGNALSPSASETDAADLAAWEAIHLKGWGRWPNTRFVEWAMSRYSRVPDRKAVSFLELGSGGGAQLAFLAVEGFSFTGVDGSQAAIQATIEWIREINAGHVNGLLAPADIRTWKPSTQPYDCIFDICTLQHLSFNDAVALVQRARKWLKPGGRFFCMHQAVGTRTRYFHPEPRRLKRGEIEMLFEGYSDVRVGSEDVETIDGEHRRHWIIEARA